MHLASSDVICADMKLMASFFLVPLDTYISDYNQSMNSTDACKRRLMKYLFPVIVFSLIFNIPKFLEAKIEYEDSGGGRGGASGNGTTTLANNMTSSLGNATIDGVVGLFNQTTADEYSAEEILDEEIDAIVHSPKPMVSRMPVTHLSHGSFFKSETLSTTVLLFYMNELSHTYVRSNNIV